MRMRQVVWAGVLWVWLLAGPRYVLGGDWPMWRYDCHRGAASPDELPVTLEPQWVRELPAPKPAWPPDQYKLQFDLSYEPVAAGKRIFVPSMISDHVTAYDTETGDQVWRFYADGPVRFAPVAFDGKVCFVSDDGYLYCVSADAGALQWKFRGGPTDRKLIGNDRLISAWPARGAPVLRDGTLYFAASIWPFMGTFIHALDADTGQAVWTNSGSGSVYIMQQHHSEAFAGVAPQGYVVATDEVLLVSGGRTVPAGYDRKTGRYRFFGVEGRSFGRDAGGYAVYAGKDWYFNRGGMYKTENGDGVMQTRASVVTDDTVFSVDHDTIVACELRLTKEEYTDRKGAKQSRTILPERWRAKLEPAINRIFVKAGRRLYGSGADGLVAAIDLPADGQDARISWQSRITGDVWNMLAADGKLFVITREGGLYCFGATSGRSVRHKHAPPVRSESISGTTSASAARDIVDRTGVSQGYCLVLGAGDSTLIDSLVADSALHVIAVDPDENKVAALRRSLDEKQVYGTRVAVLGGDLMSVELPPYLASLVVSPDWASAGLGSGQAFIERLFHVLRPYGGVACMSLPPDMTSQTVSQIVGKTNLANAEVTTSGQWTLLTRAGALPGAADWTHQYGDAANSVVSRDLLPRTPLGLLWFGGPSNTKILPRHGHGPSPQVAAGRLFIEGPDILRAVDVYTGRLLWDADLPGVGKYYDYTDHEPGASGIGSNYVSLPDAVYVAYGTKCLRLDPATGKTRSEFTLPVPKGQLAPEWGYLGAWEDLLIAGANPMAFWDPDFQVQEFEKVDSNRIKELVAAIKTWRDFDVITDGDGDKDFCVRNLNKILGQAAMELHIPPEAKRRQDRNEDWIAGVAGLRNEIQRLRRSGPDSDEYEMRRLNRQLLQYFYPLPRKQPPSPGKGNQERIASRRLVVMNRMTEKLLWTFDARYALRHNAIAAGGGRVYCIDRLPEAAIDRMKRRGQSPPADARLVALDARTGDELWSKTADVFGTWLGYSDEHGIVLQASSRGRDRAPDEVGKGIIAYDSSNGQIIWRSDCEYEGPLLLHHDTIITQHTAFSLLTGETKTRRHPLTGREIPWRYKRNYGCNTAVGSEHLLTFRSAAAGYYDLAGDGGTGNLGGFKSGCTSNLIVANGVLNAPDYTRTCDCSYQNQTSLAMLHDPDAEMWTFADIEPDDSPVLRVGVNFGAPGDRLADNGTLWLDYPSVGGDSPDIKVQTIPEHPQWFRYHASRMEGEGPGWVTCSGARGLTNVRITLAKEQSRPRRYTVSLYFCETETVAPGQRVFDVTCQGRNLLKNFDVVADAGAVNRGVVKNFSGIDVTDDLSLLLTPAASASLAEPIISGIEILAEEK